MARALSKEELIDILVSGHFDSLIGTTEGDEVEFKGAPYHLGDDRAKLELAKDISGLMNARGGVIVLGVTTIINPVVQAEEVEGI